MTRLPVISSKDLIKFLTKKKGFYHYHTTGSHHVFKNKDGSISVVIPERRELGTGLLLAILEEIGMTRDEFIQEWYR